MRGRRRASPATRTRPQRPAPTPPDPRPRWSRGEALGAERPDVGPELGHVLGERYGLLWFDPRAEQQSAGVAGPIRGVRDPALGLALARALVGDRHGDGLTSSVDDPDRGGREWTSALDREMREER